MRVVADHARASTFLIADGVVPSNEWRGYVLRKIMRRAMRHGRKLGMNEPFLYKLVDVIEREMGSAYPELGRGQETIKQVIKSEEERFDAVLTGGLPRLEEVLERAAGSTRVVAGDEAFKLYDTYGLPRDFIEDLAGNQGLRFDSEGFDAAMEGQREKARAGSAFDKKGEEFAFASDTARESLRQAGDTFEGYTETSVKGIPVVALFDAKKKPVDALNDGESGYAVLAKTPFYVEAGGQVSDQGWLESAAGRARVTGVVRLGPGLPRAHRLDKADGKLSVRDLVTAEVDCALRDATRRNHTATHLLHAALRKVLGPHVKQAGSLVAPDRLRFDFVHPSAIAPKELDAIERMVNEEVRRNTDVVTEVKPTADAIAAGAMALFGEKYGDTVRVVSIPAFSLELCGGTHCRATGDIGLFTIDREGGVAAGVRRIEALTGEGAYVAYKQTDATLDSVLQALNSAPDAAAESIQKLQAEVKRLTRELGDLKVKVAMGGASASPASGGGAGAGAGDGAAAGGVAGATDVNGVSLVARRIEGLDRAALRTLSDSIKSTLKSGVIILASEADGKVALVVSVTKDLTGKVKAGDIVRQIAPIVGGGGGGRPDFAEAGGKDPSKIDDLLKEGRTVVTQTLGAS
jgi:alanyl-tRNA synthetase